MALTPTTIPLRTGAGVTNVEAVTDGTSIWLLHGVIDTGGTQIMPAKDTTLQAATTALQALVATLSGRVKLDPGTY